MDCPALNKVAGDKCGDGFCNCLGPPIANCLLTWFCGCCIPCHLAKVGPNCLGLGTFERCCWYLVCPSCYGAYSRNEKGTGDGLIMAILAWFCCIPCAVCQEAKHVGL